MVKGVFVSMELALHQRYFHMISRAYIYSTLKVFQFDLVLKWSYFVAFIASRLYLSQSATAYYCRFTNKPPSTNNCAPFTYELKSLPRNTAGPARSLGRPVRPSGILPSIYFLFSSSSRSFSLSCVLMVPGSNALHLILCLPSAHAEDCIRDSTPAFVGV